MPAGKITKIKPINPDSKYDGNKIRLPSNETWQFDQCLNIPVIGMRILGIPLDASSIRSPYLRFWSVWFGRFFFITNISLNLMLFIEAIDGESVEIMATSDWNNLVSELNFSVALIVTNIALLGWMAPHWKDLVQVLHRIERLHLFQPDDYKIFTRYFNTGTCIFLVMVAKLINFN